MQYFSPVDKFLEMQSLVRVVSGDKADGWGLVPILKELVHSTDRSNLTAILKNGLKHARSLLEERACNGCGGSVGSVTFMGTDCPLLAPGDIERAVDVANGENKSLSFIQVSLCVCVSVRMCVAESTNL